MFLISLKLVVQSIKNWYDFDLNFVFVFFFSKVFSLILLFEDKCSCYCAYLFVYIDRHICISIIYYIESESPLFVVLLALNCKSCRAADITAVVHLATPSVAPHRCPAGRLVHWPTSTWLSLWRDNIEYIYSKLNYFQVRGQKTFPSVL